MSHSEPTVNPPQMEGSNMSLSPLPPTPSFPSSPSSSPRKRSIHEVDGASLSSSGAKRALTTFNGENQENHDPTQSVSNKETTPSKDTQAVPSPPTPQVVICSKPSVSPKSPMDIDPPVVNNATTVKPEPAAKKPKLAPTAKETKAQEKEAKERQRLEEKAKKEEEKRLRDEEKKKKDAEKEEEKRLKEEEKKKRDAERDEEKRHKEEERKKREAEREEKKKLKEAEKAAKEAAKEDERRQKEEAKLKKERAQPKLNSFFTKPQPPASPVKTALPKQIGTSPNSKATASQQPISDYAKEFPDFFLQSHTTIAPSHRFERDAEALAHVRFTIDTQFTNGDNPFELPPFRPSEIFHMIPFRRRGRRTRPVKDIMRQMQSQDDTLTQPGADQSGASLNAAIKELTEIRMKSLKFGEDVRPAYQGTFTPEVSEATTAKICRNPYFRGIPTLNYDYDSEAEWEEPEEGEDLDSEEEEEGSDDGEDDMEGFLDDEDDALAGGKRRQFVGDLEPVCSGINWAADGEPEELEQYRMQALLPGIQFPINPFSTAYWEKPSTTTNQPAKKNIFASDSKANNGPKATAGLSMRPPPAPTTKAKRPFPADLMEDFKKVVEGNDMSKIGLIEILKKRFPKVSKETLKVTLDQVAVRVGQKEADKTWTCR